ncbi:hypothetical protein, partial [Archangium sp.]|uniref:hypothetical protein n=1 Tax=Archangium sp. TaxID=1872627 RepID=UPI002D3560FC|nr:hypothetical protein [Archangium sp.]
ESVGGGVEVTFNSGSCFTQESFTVGGPTSPTATSVHTVSDSASKRHYLFTVGPAQDTAHQGTAPDTAPRKGRPPHWEAKTGDLEVVTDPPRD